MSSERMNEPKERSGQPSRPVACLHSIFASALPYSPFIKSEAPSFRLRQLSKEEVQTIPYGRKER